MASAQIDVVGSEPGIVDLAWSYPKSPTLQDLATNRQRLLKALKLVEVK